MTVRKKNSGSRSCLRKGRDCVGACACLLISLFLIFTTAAHCQTTMDPASFAGKQIKLLIGYSPTGYGYDTYGRLLARHLGKYLPGNPLVIPQIGRARARSISSNYLYNAAPKDGSEIAIVGRGVAMEPLIGGSAAQGKFDFDEIRLARQHEQRSVGDVYPARSPGLKPPGNFAGAPPADGINPRWRR